LKFTVKNEIKDNHLENFKPFQLRLVATSAGGYVNGFSKPFFGLIDTGAKHTCISSKIMNKMLPEILDINGNTLQPVAYVESQGVYGKSHRTPLYIIPNLYLDKIHLTNVAVVIPDSENFDCLIGRSILHQCISTFNPKDDTMCFEFVETSKQTLKGLSSFEEVKLFAEFSAEVASETV